MIKKAAKKIPVFLWIAFSLPCFSTEDFPDGIPDRLIGDIGGAVYTSNLHIGAEGTQSLALPYAFFDYQRFFTRIDQAGIKTAKIGYGYLEFAGKISLDSYRVKSTINGSTVNKSDPIPIGIGTFQDTPIGGFFANAYYDFGKSKGALYELSYFGELEIFKKIMVYPQFGIERQSSQYANYYYGLSPGESITTGYQSYTASASNNPFIGLMLEVPVTEQWFINMYSKRKWMGGGINNSPVMNKSFQNTIFTALAYRFQ
jgi:outer membrane protein